MAGGRRIDLRDLIDLEQFLDDTPDVVKQAMAYAMNDVIEGPRGLGVYRREIGKQIAFPPGYLNDSERLGMDQRAVPNRLVASVVARQRPTSLARFATGGTIGSKGGVAVKVKPGGASKTFKSGFLVRLRSGTSMENGNIGLAVRLSPGTVLDKRDQSNMVHLEANVVLLYGPSIDQVLNTSVADATTPEVADSIVEEFYRQYTRLNDGR